MLKILRITGQSMSPTLNEGDYILVLCRFFRLKLNDLVVVQHHSYPILIKRLAYLDQHTIELESDNQQLGLSREQMGQIKREAVIGKVIYCIKAS